MESFKIAVMSGKGGVGKSTIASLLAVHYARNGKKVGILDTDLLGPSIPFLFSVQNKKLLWKDDKILPVESLKYGIKIVSVQFMLTKPDEPVMWRGPLVSGFIKEVASKVDWDVDYLIIDLPPGTGDAPLIVVQEIKPNGIVIVTTPQELASLIVEKSIKFCEKAKLAILALVENMSHFVCPHCGKKSYIFGEGRAEKLFRKYRPEFFVEIPIDPELLRLSEKGRIEDYATDWFAYFPY